MTSRPILMYAWLAAITAALIYIAWPQFHAGAKTADFDEINVQRINIVEPNGYPRVIVSNRARMAGLYWGGKEYKHHSRDEGGFLFFNDDGDEVGGMIFNSRSQGKNHSAGSRLLFDQYKQGETLSLAYGEENGQRQAGLTIFDQPDESIFPAIELSDRLMSAGTEEERARLKAEMEQMGKSLQEKGYFTTRFFAGKALGESLVRLADQEGRPRLVLKVDADGAASIEFLDEGGKVTRRIPEK